MATKTRKQQILTGKRKATGNVGIFLHRKTNSGLKPRPSGRCEVYLSWPENAADGEIRAGDEGRQEKGGASLFFFQKTEPPPGLLRRYALAFDEVDGHLYGFSSPLSLLQNSSSKHRKGS
jgi:hypothetical protein